MSLLPPNQPPDPVEGASGHFEHTNWVTAALHALNNGLLRRVGDQLFDGALTTRAMIVQGVANTAHLYLKANGVRAVTGVANDDKARWALQLGDATADGASDAGSLFKLLAYGNDGTLKHTALQANRGDGLLTVRANPTAALGVATKQLVDDAMPIGAIIAYGGSAAPPGWHLCNGTAHGSAALQAVLGSTLTPNLSGRFIVAAGTGYNPGSTGGAETVTLTGAQSGQPGHAHSASSAGETQEHQHHADPPAAWTGGHNTDHSHGGTTDFMDRNWSHTHSASVNEGITTGDSDRYIDTADNDPNRGEVFGPVTVYPTDTNHRHNFSTGGASTDHSHLFDPPAFWTGGRSAVHNHAITVDPVPAANAAQAHENRPPYYALVYIIRKG